MPSIAIELPECGFLEDLPDVTFSDVTETCYVTVQLDDAPLLANVRFTPDKQNRVVIYVKQMIRNLVSLTGPGEVETVLPMLRVLLRVGETTLTTSGTVIPGGTNKSERIDRTWFTRNFLTWQPQIIETTRQQPQWLAYTASSLTYLTHKISTRLYTRDGRKIEKNIRTDSGKTALYFRQVQTDFMHLWSAECENQNLDPIAYDVYGESNRYMETVQAEDQNVPSGPIIFPSSFITRHAQRYILRPERYNDVCFGFENTLGGFDTLMLDGKQSYQPEGDVTTFKTEAIEKELVNNYTSIWEAHTGRLETERLAAQFQDFLKSSNRYVLLAGIWHRIIVSEHKVKHYRGESNAYTFKYHLAERNERRFYERSELPEVELPIIL